MHQPELETFETETSVQEDLLSSIRQFRKQQKAVREKFLRESDEELAPSHQKIDHAEEFMSESGLTESFPKVWMHAQHWASWLIHDKSFRENTSEHTAFEVSNITGDKDGPKGDVVAFEYKGHHFQFILEEQESSLSDGLWKYANMSLALDGEKVLQISCALDLDDIRYLWLYQSVTHLVIGDWVQSIVEMHELVELYDLKVAREFGGSMIEDQAENLPD